MAITVSDVRDLLQVLREHPEWHAAARQEIVGQEVLGLPALVQENTRVIADLRRAITEDRAANEARAERMQQQIDEWARRSEEADRRLDAFIAESRRVTDAIAVTVKQLGDRVDAFIAESERIRSEDVTRHARYDTEIADLKEWKLEDQYARTPTRILRGVRRPIAYRKGEYPGADESSLSDAELTEIDLLDLIVTGRRGRGPDSAPVTYGIEISYTIDQGDVLRAARRVGLLQKAGIDATAAVAGQNISPRTRELARENGVEVLLEIPDDV